eukprot:PhM_4_TR11296/c5_g1_i1/m.93316
MTYRRAVLFCDGINSSASPSSSSSSCLSQDVLVCLAQLADATLNNITTPTAGKATVCRTEQDVHAAAKGSSPIVLACPEVATRGVLYVLRQNAFFLFFDCGGASVFRDFYDARVLVGTHADKLKSDVAGLEESVRSLCAHNAFFVSTRGGVPCATTPSVLVEGLARDGGLYVPQSLPHIPRSELHRMVQRCVSYCDVAQTVLERLLVQERSVGSVLTPQVLHSLVGDAYSAEFWSHPDVCPVTRLSDTRTAILELFHGPTAAFKDFALQLFPRMFNVCWSQAERYDASRCLVLAATSGDTGIAAIQGFVNAQKASGSGARVLVLYPTHGVSEVQRQQMIKANGAAARVVGVESNFDTCQSAVKRMFGSASFKSGLKAQANVELSSANSINWGRLAPQIVYYFHAYFHAVRSEWIRFGERLDVVVPTGNFGNIMCCYFAKRLGLPIGRLVVASNENNVLSDFVTTGVYDISERSLRVTASPSIDILRASNVERFLYYLTDGDVAEVRRCMHDLDTKKRFELNEQAKAVLQGTMVAGWCTEPQCRAMIKSTYDTHGVVLDTHTAVAMHVAQQLRSDHFTIIASTAHYAKFPHAVLEAFTGKPTPPAMSISSVYAHIRQHAPKGSKVPPAFEEVVPNMCGARTIAADFDKIEAEVQAFACEGAKGQSKL